MKKKPLIIILVGMLLFCALLLFLWQQENVKLLEQEIDTNMKSFYLRDSKEVRQSLELKDVERVEELINNTKDPSHYKEELEELESLKKLLAIREELRVIDKGSIDDFSNETFRELLIKINDIQNISIRERELLYALREDHENNLLANQKLQDFNGMMTELLDVDPTKPEEVKKLLDTIKEAGAESLLEDYMGDLWERYALAESLENYLTQTGDFTPEDAKAFSDLMTTMQEKGMKVDDYLELSRIMSLLSKAKDVGLLGLSSQEFFELLSFYQSIDGNQQDLLTRPLIKEIERQLRNLLGNRR